MRACRFRGVSVALMLMVTSFAASCRRPPERPPLVLLLSLDTVRPSHLGAYGYGRSTSPNLDAFAESATLFEHAWSTGSWTLPSHASLFLSQYSHVHGIYGRDHSISDRAEILTEQLRAAGYRTGGFYSVSYLSEGRGFGRGFDHYESIRSTPGRGDGAQVTESGLRWLDEAGDAQPSFLFLHYFDAHAPYGREGSGGPEACRIGEGERALSYREVAARVALDYLLGEGLDPLDLGWTDMEPRTRKVEAALRDSGYPKEAAEFRSRLQLNAGVGPAEQACLLELYDEGIRELDRHLGHLFDELKRREMFEDALILIVSDHGETLYARDGFRAHGRYVYDFLTRAVFMVKRPGQRSGARIANVPVSLVDVWPTIAEFLGVSTGSGQQGRSLSSLVTDGDSDADRVVLTENISPRSEAQALIAWPYKLIVDHRGGRVQLFDLAGDPGESKDPSADRPRVVAQLRSHLQKLVAAAPVSEAPGEGRPTTDELEELRALGYVQ